MIREAAILHRLALAVRRALLTIVLLLASRQHRAGAHARHGADRGHGCRHGALPGRPDPDRPAHDRQLRIEPPGLVRALPFDVPAGTTAVRVKYCFDQPEVPTPNVRHTLDLGIYDPRGFRGWGGSSHPDVTLSPEGFSTEAEYLAKPKGNVPGKTTRGFRPGPIRPGQLVRRARPGRDRRPRAGRRRRPGRLARRDRALQRPRVRRRAVPQDALRPRSPRASAAGWYTGDLHVHAEHSALGDATMRETFGYAFAAARAAQARLHHAHRLRQRRRRGARSAATSTTTPAQARRAQRGGHHLPRPHEQPGVARTTSTTAPARSTSARRRRARPAAARARPPTRALRRRPRRRRLHADQPPDDLPVVEPALRAALPRLPVGLLRRGDATTRKVDAIEVSTGPARLGEAPNPFTPMRSTSTSRRSPGRHVAAVGVERLAQRRARARARASRRSAPGRPSSTPASSPSAGISCAVKAGHTYAKIGGASGPDLRLTGRVPGARKRAIFGDSARGRSLKLAAKATGGGVLQLLRDGSVIATGSALDRAHRTDSGRYGLRLGAARSPKARRHADLVPRGEARPGQLARHARAACAASRRPRA